MTQGYASFVTKRSSVRKKPKNCSKDVSLRRGLLAVAAVVGAFWIVLPLAPALGITHRPRASVESADLGPNVGSPGDARQNEPS